MHNGKLKEYNDTICRHNYLDVVKNEKINRGDVLVQLSLNGAQLYHDKESDCWIIVYIIHKLPPKTCYKKRFIIPVGFISDSKMKDGKSFIFPELYHISVFQNQGL
jgi:hypothetical protein